MASRLKRERYHDIEEDLFENKMNKSIISTHDLIESVKKKPAIWDKNSKDYRYTNRTKLWYELTEELVPNFASLDKSTQHDIVLQLTKKWYNVRDSYRKSLRIRKPKPYIYSDSLSFLDSVMMTKFDKTEDNDEETVTYNFGEKSDGEEYDTVYLEEEETAKEIRKKNKSQEIFLEVDDIDVTPAKVLKTALSKGNFSSTERQNTSFSPDDSLLSIITNIYQREDDEDRAFFNSLLPTVKTLSDKDKLDFRIQVMTCLKKFAVKKEKDPIDDNDSE